MHWTDALGLAGFALLVGINVLTWLQIAHTLKKLRSSPAPLLPPAIFESESNLDGDGIPRVWADDVLAEDEMRTRETRGAADHFTDVCTYWDEQDEREAKQEQAARITRTRPSP